MHHSMYVHAGMQWYAYPLHFPYQHPVPACRDKNKAGFHGRFLFSVQMFNRQVGKPWLRRHLSSPIHVLLWEPKHVAGDFGICLVAATHERAKEHVCFNWQSHGGKAAMLAIDLCRTFICANCTYSSCARTCSHWMRHVCCSLLLRSIPLSHMFAAPSSIPTLRQ